jgi:hypothetical protein
MSHPAEATHVKKQIFTNSVSPIDPRNAIGGQAHLEFRLRVHTFCAK